MRHGNGGQGWIQICSHRGLSNLMIWLPLEQTEQGRLDTTGCRSLGFLNEEAVDARNLHSPNRRPEKIPWDLLGVIKPSQAQEIPSTLLEAGTVRERHQHSYVILTLP